MPTLRRAFVLPLVLGVLVACGDDPSSPIGGEGEPMEPQQRIAVLAAVTDRVNQLAGQHGDPGSLNAAIAAWLGTRREFAQVGIEGETVWAVFEDGRGLVIPSNLVLGDSTGGSGGSAVVAQRGGAVPGGSAPTPAPPAPSLAPPPTFPHATSGAAASTPAELPESRRARLLHTFSGTTEFARGSVKAIAEMSLMLQEGGWQVTSGGAESSTVEALRGVSGDGFFYLNTHGAPGQTWYNRQIKGVFALQSSSIVTLLGETDAQTKADLDAGRLVYMIANASGAEGSGWWSSDMRYAITTDFVTHYMSFSSNAVVFLNACDSGRAHPVTEAMAAAFRAKGAGVTLGWTAVVRGWLAWEAAKMLVDRMIGANRFEPEPSAHRPFPLDAVLDHMEARGRRGNDTVWLSVMGSPSALLRPSIMRVRIDTLFSTGTGQLVVYGAFGSDPGAANRRVFIRDGGEVTLTVTSWTPDSIRVLPILDQQARGFHGDVVVEVRGRPSNPRRLHAWYGTATYRIRGPGTLEVRFDMDVVGRFDPDSVRRRPGAPAEANVGLQVFEVNPTPPYPDVQARWTASGSSPSPDCGTITWSGSGSTLSSQVTADRAYIFQGALDPVAERFILRRMQVQATAGYTITCGQGGQVPAFFSSSMFLSPGTTDIYLRYDVDPRTWRVIGRTHPLPGDELTLTFDWPEMQPMPVYNPSQRK
jgi:hypothetical protein